MSVGKKQTTWGKVAPWYEASVKDTQSYQQTVLLPNILRLLQVKKGTHILDIACGHGFFSHAIEAMGAQVSGYDISPELISIAERGASKQETFGVAPSHKLPVQSGVFDTALIVLALQNIEKWKETIKEASRALVSGGKFILVLNHPAFRIPRGSFWGYDAKRDVQYRAVDRYLSDLAVKIDMHPGEKDPKKKHYTTSFHRPIHAYIKALVSAGFVIDDMEEWVSQKKSDRGPRQKAEDRARKEFPLFMTIIAHKI